MSHVDPSDGYETFSVEYVRRKNSDIIDYIPEFADSLSDEWDSTINGESIIDDSDPSWEIVRTHDSESMSTNSSRFGRVRVLFNP